MVMVSGSVFLGRRDGRDSERSLSHLTCLEVATCKQGSTGSRRVVQGGRKGASCTDHHSEQPVGCVVDGEGERFCFSGIQGRWGQRMQP